MEELGGFPTVVVVKLERHLLGLLVGLLSPLGWPCGEAQETLHYWGIRNEQKLPGARSF